MTVSKKVKYGKIFRTLAICTKYPLECGISEIIQIISNFATTLCIILWKRCDINVIIGQSYETLCEINRCSFQGKYTEEKEVINDSEDHQYNTYDRSADNWTQE